MGYIMVVEDESAIADRLKQLLLQKKLKVIVSREYHDAIAKIDEVKKEGEKIDVLVCDLNIKPIQTQKLDAVGFQILRYIKTVSPETHCVIYTGVDTTVVAVKCIGLVGVGDRFFQKTSKPGQMEYYKATVQEIADYVHEYYETKKEDEITYCGTIIMNHTKRTVVIDGDRVDLEPHEFVILEKMIFKPGVYFGMDELRDLILETKPVPFLAGEAGHLRNCMNKFVRVVGRKHVDVNNSLGFALK